MAWNNLSAEQRVRVLLELVGGPRYSAQMKKAAVETAGLGTATRRTGKEMGIATHKGFLWNQMIFTGRRYTFYATLAVVSLAAGIVKLGFSYQNTMQQAKAALRTILGTGTLMTNTINRLFLIAAKTPFQFADITRAFSLMYSGFKPLGISIEDTTNTVYALTNALAVAFKNTPAALQRASIALQHLAYAGRLTGYTVNQLWRDGIPMAAILNKELGITGDQLHNISDLGIDTATVLRAIRHYLTTEAPFAGAAFRSQTETLQGAFSTFKDFLSQAAGGSTGGPFNFLTKFFQQLDTTLYKNANKNKPTTLTDIVTAIDQILSPKTHAVINFFEFMTGVINAFTFAVRLSTQAISLFLRPFTIFFNMFGGRGGGMAVARIAGWAIGLLLFISLTRRAVTALKILISVLRAELALEAAAAIFGGGRSLGGLFKRKKVYSPTGALGKGALTYDLVFANRFTRLLATGFRLAATGAVKLAAGVLLISRAFLIFLFTNPLGWAILVIGTLVILYFKWKRFHDLVDKTWHLIHTNKIAAALATAFAPIIAAALALEYIINNMNKIPNYGQDLKHHVGTTASEVGTAFRHPLRQTPAQTERAKDPWNFAGIRLRDVVPFMDSGGVVPGAIGSPRVIVAHGGETVLPTHKSNTGDDGRPQLIELKIGEKTFAKIVAKSNADVKARF